MRTRQEKERQLSQSGPTAGSLRKQKEPRSPHRSDTPLPCFPAPTALEVIRRHKNGDLGHMVGLEGAVQVFRHVNIHL